ncbi:MAG TPA: hypothetical protein VFD92_24225 [Candidatus Binatia bacterium]|nr:hypothetical protein [Candidatus Binatia bacterium]
MIVALGYCLSPFVSVAAAASDQRADVIIYGDHDLDTFADGTQFRNPFTYQTDRTPGSVDPVTRLKLETVPGIRNTPGALQWGLATYGKYVVVGDFAGLSTFLINKNADDQQIGIFDSEAKTFCKLDVDPDPIVKRSATQRGLVVANPASRFSRILFAGTDNGCFRCTSPGHCSGFGCPAERAFGWIEADLDATDPCTQWPAFLGPEDSVNYDGMALLNHQDVPGDFFGIDVAVLSDYFAERIAVMRIDPGGAAIATEYSVPRAVVPKAGGGTCVYRRSPVQQPEVDRTSPIADRRFVVSFDVLQDPSNVGCGDLGGGKHAQEYRIDLTASTPVIEPVGPFFSGFTSSDSSDDQGAIVMWPDVYYKKVAGQTCMLDGMPTPAVAGERCLYNPARASELVDITADQTLPFETNGPANAVAHRHHLQVSSRLYCLVSSASIQRANLIGGAWQVEDDTSYKIGLGRFLLPSEPRSCSGGGNHFCACPPGTDPAASCAEQVRCDPAAGQVCEPNETESPVAFFRDLVVGGAPPSLWTADFFTSDPDFTPAPNSSLYIFRVPVEVAVPDGESSIGMATAWSGQRLWMVGRQSGAYVYRTRDDGLWSPWSALPSDVSLGGSIAAVATTTAVELFARGDSDNVLYESTLTSPIDCDSGQCTWSPWTALNIGTSIQLAGTPAVAYQNGAAPFIVIRNGVDGKIYYTRRVLGSWAPWRLLVDGLVTDMSPAITYNPVDQFFWVAARQAGLGVMRWTKFKPTQDGGIGFPWRKLGASASLVPWQTAPAISFEGNASGGLVRIFAAAADSVGSIYQAVSDGKRFRRFQGMKSGAQATQNIAVSVVNGDVNLFTRRGGQVFTSLAK